MVFQIFWVMIFVAIILLWYSKYIFFNFQVKEVIAKVAVKAIVAKNGTKSNSSTNDSSRSRRGTSSSTNGRSGTSSSSSPNNGSKSSPIWKKTRWNDSPVLFLVGKDRFLELQTKNWKLSGGFQVEQKHHKASMATWPENQISTRLTRSWVDVTPAALLSPLLCLGAREVKNTSRVVWIMGLRCWLTCKTQRLGILKVPADSKVFYFFLCDFSAVPACSCASFFSVGDCKGFEEVGISILIRNQHAPWRNLADSSNVLRSYDLPGQSGKKRKGRR